MNFSDGILSQTAKIDKKPRLKIIIIEYKIQGLFPYFCKNSEKGKYYHFYLNINLKIIKS